MDLVRKYCLRHSINFTMLYVLSIAIVAIHLTINFWALDKGYITCDEGWYMYLFDHRCINTSSQGHVIFGSFSALNDIYLNRLFAYVLILISSIVFSLGFDYYLRKRLLVKSSWVIILGLMFLTRLCVTGCSTINYNQLAHVFVPLSLGILFYALVKSRLWLYVLSGFILAFVMPTKATSAVIVPIAVAIVWWLTNPKFVGAYISGGILGLLFFVLIIESPTEVTQWLTYATSPRQYGMNEEYTSNSILLWLWRALLIYGKWILIALIIIACHYIIWKPKLRWVSNTLRYVTFSISAAFIFLFIWLYVYPYPYLLCVDLLMRNLIGATVFMGCLCTLIYHHNRDYVGIAILLLFTPISISLGTNIEFINHHTSAYMATLLVIAFTLPKSYGQWFKWVGVLLFIANLWIFISRPLDNWYGDIYTEQTEAISTTGINQRVKVDPAYIDRIRFYQQHASPNGKYIVSRKCWAIAQLLNLDVYDTEFRQNNTSFIESKIGDDIKGGKDVFIIFDYDEYNDADLHSDWHHVLDDLSEHYNVDMTLSHAGGIACVSGK